MVDTNRISKNMFLRESSGLVKEFGLKDIASLNLSNLLFGIGLIYIINDGYLFPNGSMILGTAIMALLGIFPAIVYGMLTHAVGKTYSDYVTVARSSHPALGTAIAISTLFWAWLWAATFVYFFITYALPITLTEIGYFLGIPSLINISTQLTTTPYILGLGILTIVAFIFIAVRSNKALMNIVTISIGLGTLANIIVIISLLMVSHSQFVNIFNSYAAHFVSNTNYYSYIISEAQKLGYSSTSFSFYCTLGIVGLAAWTFLYVSVQQYVAAEIKGRTKISLYGTLIPLAISGIISILTIVLFIDKVGLTFINSIDYLANTDPSAYSLPVSPSYFYLASIIANYINPALSILIGIGFITWNFALIPFNFLIGSRVVLALSMDRLLPGFFGSVKENWHTPYASHIINGSLMIVMIIVYSTVGSSLLSLNAVFGNILAWIIEALVFIFLPFLRKSNMLIEGTIIEKWKIGDLPVFSIASIGWLATLGLIAYLYLTNASFGVNGIPSLVTVSLVTVGGAIYYFLAKLIRERKDNIDLSLLFKEIPPD
ncbi:hypothetical protein D1867_06455 [Acidianus infernus]|uniref:APC family permease n=1 Tax=Acidianus infernus TaxID=12915 RepID=A0A6A9QCH1_ACIIN|nr:APC family permease [Acidianus infernus]MUM64891.1 hypothetical protein [Acidianus infernus]